DSMIVSNGRDGAYCPSCNGLAVRNCQFNNNGENGLNLAFAHEITIEKTLFNQNGQSGFPGAMAGLQCLQSTRLAVQESSAFGNADGFYIIDFGFGTASTVGLFKCVALGNSDAGFYVDGTSSALMRECTANNNGTGFNNISAGSVLAYATSGCNNGVN